MRLDVSGILRRGKCDEVLGDVIEIAMLNLFIINTVVIRDTPFSQEGI